MARLEPEAILAPQGQYNRKPHEVAAMLRRYGFNLERSGLHSVYKHSRYPEIFITTANLESVKVVDAGAATYIANACMAVKQRDAARAEGGADQPHTLPDWLTKGIPPEFTIRVDDDHVMHLSHAANGSVARGYTIHRAGNKLIIQSDEFPDRQAESFFSENDRTPANAFRHAFNAFDDQILGVLPPMEVGATSEPPVPTVDAPSSGDSPAQPQATGVGSTAGSKTTSPSKSGDFAQRVPKPVQRSRKTLERMVDDQLASNGPNDRISFADALTPSEFIAPALAKSNDSSQPLLQDLDKKAKNVKGILLSLAQAIDHGDPNIEDSKEKLHEALGVYAAGLKLIPHMEDSHDNGRDTIRYVVIDPIKYEAAISLEHSVDKMVGAMQPPGKAR